MRAARALRCAAPTRRTPCASPSRPPSCSAASAAARSPTARCASACRETRRRSRAGCGGTRSHVVRDRRASGRDRRGAARPRAAAWIIVTSPGRPPLHRRVRDPAVERLRELGRGLAASSARPTRRACMSIGPESEHAPNTTVASIACRAISIAPSASPDHAWIARVDQRVLEEPGRVIVRGAEQRAAEREMLDARRRSDRARRTRSRRRCRDRIRSTPSTSIASASRICSSISSQRPSSYSESAALKRRKPPHARSSPCRRAISAPSSESSQRRLPTARRPAGWRRGSPPHARRRPRSRVSSAMSRAMLELGADRRRSGRCHRARCPSVLRACPSSMRAPDLLRDVDGLPADVDRLGVPAREHQLLPERGEHPGPFDRRRHGRDELHRLEVLDEVLVGGPVHLPQVATEPFVREPGFDRIRLGVDFVERPRGRRQRRGRSGPTSARSRRRAGAGATWLRPVSAGASGTCPHSASAASVCCSASGIRVHLLGRARRPPAWPGARAAGRGRRSSGTTSSLASSVASPSYQSGSRSSCSAIAAWSRTRSLGRRSS